MYRGAPALPTWHIFTYNCLVHANCHSCSDITISGASSERSIRASSMASSTSTRCSCPPRTSCRKQHQQQSVAFVLYIGASHLLLLLSFSLPGIFSTPMHVWVPDENFSFYYRFQTILPFWDRIQIQVIATYTFMLHLALPGRWNFLSPRVNRCECQWHIPLALWYIKLWIYLWRSRTSYLTGHIIFPTWAFQIHIAISVVPQTPHIHYMISTSYTSMPYHF